VHAFWHLDRAVVLSRDIAAEGLYPALDPLASWSKALDPAVVGDRHYAAVQEACVLGRWQELRDIISMLGMEELSAEDRVLVGRARRLRGRPARLPARRPSVTSPHAGLDPRACQSGTSVDKPARISKVGNAHIRRALFMPALVAVQHEPHIKAFFAKLVARGKKPIQA
jgi:hypothetical protein